MTKNEKITPFQLFSLIMLFELGTSIMVPLGVDAKQDAWMTILIGMACGILMFSIYAYLFNRYPKLLLTGYMSVIFGKVLGFILGIAYVLFFIYGAARDLRDGLELLALFYDVTPIFVLGILMIGAVGYALFMGIETLGRTGEIYFIALFLSGITWLLLLLFSPDTVKINQVMPILENGWMPVFKTVYEQTAMFPFGEMICFSFVLPFLNNAKTGYKVGLTAILASGIIIALVVFLEISVLGVSKLQMSTFPLLSMTQRIRVGDFIQRLDAIAVAGVIVNDFFKVAIFSYAALSGSSDLFKVSKNKLVIPIVLIALLASLFIARNVVAHFEQGKFALTNIFPIFAVAIPFLLMMTDLIRKGLGYDKQRQR
ncbi:GerAB/ArcD/ProY family transporter [Paenibacillus caui]|uniref:GerAB/ArcD/ProY family transporter n=1 Tax=Paenibacillus caui TaxID=2873927 RepID=UPI001CA80493|nr:GerAB/ArcD/ProY family transporter [Paenibacillus caui]